MANVKQSLDALLQIDGAMAAALVDASTGMLLGGVGSGIDLEIAAAGNTELVRAMLKTSKALGIADTIDDILVTLSSQYHVIRPSSSSSEVFLYLVLERDRSTLAMARIKVKDVDSQLEI